MNESFPVSKMDGMVTVKNWSKKRNCFRVPHKYVLCFNRIGDKWEWSLLKDVLEVHDSETYIGNIYFVGKVLGSSSILFREGVNHHVFDPYPSQTMHYTSGPIKRLYFGDDLYELIGEHFDEML